jgi:hypothetical protein
MTARAVLGWIVAAVLGLALAAGLTQAVSQLSSQRIGLSGEPLSAGDQLVPHPRRHPTARPAPPAAVHPSRGDDANESDD